MQEKKVSVAMVGMRGIPARYGGSETAVEEIGWRLAKEGHRIVVYCRRHNSQTDAREYRGMERVVLPSIHSKNWDTPSHTLISLLHILWKGGVDVIHFNGVGNAIFLPFLKLTSLKSVVGIDGPDWERPKWGWFARKVLKGSAWLTARMADGVIADNLVSQKLYREKFSRETDYIPYGTYAVDENETDELEKFGLAKDDYLLYVGRWIPDKGVHVLVKAFEKVQTTKKLALVGGNPYFPDYIRELKSTQDPRIKFLGYVYDRPYRQLCGNAYMYVHPLIVDGTSPQLLQAMGYGNCIVASDLPEINDVVGDSAHRFPSGDVEELRAVLQELVSDPATVQVYKKKARERVSRLFNWDEVAAQTGALYQRVAARSHSR